MVGVVVRRGAEGPLWVLIAELARNGSLEERLSGARVPSSPVAVDVSPTPLKPNAIEAEQRPIRVTRPAASSLPPRLRCFRRAP